ncbi:hypothetical protein [Actinospica sp.]|jgi:hypothetical protein|uniref:hypothetical protein n=1 Tax=Actinospica sp. TaxID=1872142 RepID=UPI002B6F441A|nr:hypothetical protein [Actinospica sp.]HWG26297.1 hypothetical protein [Actinospica sp.]
MTREPVLPAVRAAVFTAVCLGLSVAAHGMMSGAAIPAWAVVLGAIGVYASARAGSRRERGLLGIALLMGVLQIVLHLLFAYAQDAASVTRTASASMPGMPAGMSMPMPGMAMPQPDAAMRMGSGMLIGHALAALACAWWLRRGEAGLHGLARSAALWAVEHLAPQVRTVPIPIRTRSFRPVETVVLALRSQCLLTSRLLRGPPISLSLR